LCADVQLFLAGGEKISSFHRNVGVPRVGRKTLDANPTFNDDLTTIDTTITFLGSSATYQILLLFKILEFDDN
jgi:hypothetical protein